MIARRGSVGLALFGLVAAAAQGATELPLELPLELPPGSVPPLIETIDPPLQGALERLVAERPEWQRLARRSKLAIGVVDLSEPTEPRFARINGRSMMYAASLPKIGILLAAHVALEEGTLEDTPEVREDMAAMIRVSSNTSATAMIDRLGFEKIAEVLRDPRFQLYDEKRGGGLWVGKRYAKSGRRVGDPLRNISHAANVTQVCRFYYLLATGRVINRERSREMLRDLGDPGLHHKFVGVLEQRAPLARLFRKSGTWQIWHSDSVLVWGPNWRRYILVAMVESADGDQLLREIVPAVEKLIQPGAQERVAARRGASKRSGLPG